MDAYQAYQLYCALKTHFIKPDYNYFIHQRTKTSIKAFNKRKDYYFFDKIADHYTEVELVDFFVSQLITNSNFWIGDSFSDLNQGIYNIYQTTKQSLTRRLQQDLKIIHEYTTTEIYNPVRGYPKLISLYLGDRVRLETLVLLDIHNDWVAQSAHMTGLVGTPLRLLISKYRPFIDSYDMSKFAKLLSEIVEIS